MELSKRIIILDSWKRLKKHLSLWLVIMIFIISFNIIISILQEKLLVDITLQSILFTLASILFQAGINLGMLQVALNIHYRKEPLFNNIFSKFHLLFIYMVSSLLFLLILVLTVIPGIILLSASMAGDLDQTIINSESLDNISIIIVFLFIIIPASYMSIRLQFYNYFIVDEECSAWDSIKKSYTITRGFVGELFILGAIISVIILLSMIPLMIGLLVSMPLATMINTVVFIKLKKNNNKYIN